MKPEDFSFCGRNPGTAKLGNFINYYSFHSARERLDNISPDMFPQFTGERPIVSLDIGCNTGELSKELYSYLKNTVYPESDVHMVAIDIDPTLIQRAEETNGISGISFVTADIMNKNDHILIQNFLDLHKKETFDITFCFSVTMWIHLNNGDEKFLDFLQFVKDKSYTIIIEPQPWNCYRNAQRRMKKSGSSFPLYEKLKIRSDIDTLIEHVLSEKSHKKVCESIKCTWNRKIQSFQMIDR